MQDGIVWIDLETTGLDPQRCHILEIACVVTDHELNEVFSYQHVIGADDYRLAIMDPWCKLQHSRSGLIGEVRANQHVTKYRVEQELSKQLREMPNYRALPLGGSSVHFDRSFLKVHMPLVHECLTYRNIDVSTVGELAKRWNERVRSNAPRSACNHRAMDDIQHSISLMRFYRENLFIST